MALFRALQKCTNLVLSGRNLGLKLTFRECQNKVATRKMGSHSFPPIGSFDLTHGRKRLYDDIVYYFTLHAIPVIGVVLAVNVMYGKSELVDIPEGYEPEHWEYYEHPITRFMAKYCVQPPDLLYESSMENRVRKVEVRKMNLLQRKVRQLNRRHQDFETWYYVGKKYEDWQELKENIEGPFARMPKP